MEYKEEIDRLAKEFESCQKILLALGDENRQHLILEMIQMEQCNGVRVGTITEKTHLSRPAVSHHIQILKEAGILKVRKEGTKNNTSKNRKIEFQSTYNQQAVRKVQW